MTIDKDALRASIAEQRKLLKNMMRGPMHEIAARCVAAWGQREAMDTILLAALSEIPNCKYLYGLDSSGVQITDNISHEGLLSKDFGRDRSMRPYMQQIKVGQGFMLSDAYISVRAKRPSLTALQTVFDANGKLLGYLGADFDLRDLPLTREVYEEAPSWQQIKGDPAIRTTVFHQTRTDSRMDRHMDEVLGVLEELVLEHGFFHVKLHFSSSRATIWLTDDPFRYRLMDIDMLIDPDICLAYPRRVYPDNALVPAGKIRAILENLRELRFMDDTFYLRSGGLNIFNGMVSLTFSCDGSHYIPWNEFLNKKHAFWASQQTVC
ncbi:MAG: PDC sensor domain-containing protein [Chromatiales bacterium]|nr:PDC sensor domain-containing protein [Gammaproteobacteria bacterium]MBW6477119.1 PDC sensor domain-containing protein [Chromatiales bacterium]